MKQSLLLSILILSLSSSSFVAPIHARNKSTNSPSPSPVATPAPGSSNADCSTIIYSMMDCLSYLSIGSNDTKPEKSCCVGIETVLDYNPQCICAGLKSGHDMGIELNTTRALATPKDCNIPIAPPHCGVMIPGASTPGASTPNMSPVSPSAGTPMTSPSSSESPATSPSLAESPAMTTAPSPSSSRTNNLSVPTLTLVALLVSFIAYILAFSN